MKRSHLNLVLLAAVAGLGAAVWFGEKKEEKGPPLTALKQDAITRIAVEHPGKPAIRLEKKDGKWNLTEPVKGPTDPFEVNGILSLAELEVKSKLDSGVNKAELELEPPKYSVTLDDVRIDLGGAEPIKFRRYVKSGDMIGLVDDPPSAALDADFSDLVAKTLVPESAALTKIELPGLLLEKNADGAWTSPQQGEATPAQVAALAEGWKNARALWNAADPPEGSKGDEVKLTLADGQVIALIAQARDPQLILARKEMGVRYTLSKLMAQELFEIPNPPKPDVPATEAVEP
ncbi:MAG: DUF4340 domain-containing protein [Panacagrimonas sp.]